MNISFEFIRNLKKYRDNPKVKGELLKYMRIKYVHYYEHRDEDDGFIQFEMYHTLCEKCLSVVGYLNAEENTYVTCPSCGSKVLASGRQKWQTGTT